MKLRREGLYRIFGESTATTPLAGGLVTACGRNRNHRQAVARQPVARFWWGFLVVCLPGLTALGVASPVHVDLRAPIGTSGMALTGEFQSATPAGLILTVDGATRIASWDVIAGISGTGSDAARPFADLAQRVWRARARLERDDWPAAEPLFESVLESVRGSRGPTPALVYDGLLRCRLERGARARAVWAWLDGLSAAADRSGWIGGGIDAAAITDAETGLLPLLPPIWIAGAGVDSAAGSSEWERFVNAGGEAGSTTRAAVLARLYRASLRSEAGLDTGVPDPALDHPTGTDTTDKGVQLVREIVASRSGDDEQRLAARAALRSRIESGSAEPWLEAWVRAALGRSLLREKGDDLRREGVLELLHVPARFGRLAPELAAIALAEAAVALRETGDLAGARALRDELLRHYPGSAGAAWRRLGEISGEGTPKRPPEAPVASEGS